MLPPLFRRGGHEPAIVRKKLDGILGAQKLDVRGEMKRIHSAQSVVDGQSSSPPRDRHGNEQGKEVGPGIPESLESPLKLRSGQRSLAMASGKCRMRFGVCD
ncbi:MAG: hypothetical protein AAB285_02960, partial [candidate division NC10 bacterium]